MIAGRRGEMKAVLVMTDREDLRGASLGAIGTKQIVAGYKAAAAADSDRVRCPCRFGTTAQDRPRRGRIFLAARATFTFPGWLANPSQRAYP